MEHRYPALGEMEKNCKTALSRSNAEKAAAFEVEVCQEIPAGYDPMAAFSEIKEKYSISYDVSSFHLGVCPKETAKTGFYSMTIGFSETTETKEGHIAYLEDNICSILKNIGPGIEDCKLEVLTKPKEPISNSVSYDKKARPIIHDRTNEERIGRPLGSQHRGATKKAIPIPIESAPQNKDEFLIDSISMRTWLGIAAIFIVAGLSLCASIGFIIRCMHHRKNSSGGRYSRIHYRDRKSRQKDGKDRATYSFDYDA